jgi:hypothetical protein
MSTHQNASEKAKWINGKDNPTPETSPFLKLDSSCSFRPKVLFFLVDNGRQRRKKNKTQPRF